MTTGTSTGAFIKVDKSYQVGVESKKFRLTDTYLKAGLTEYIIKDAGIIRTRNKMYYQQFSQALTHPICNNLIRLYSKIDLPTSEELHALDNTLAGLVERVGAMQQGINRLETKTDMLLENELKGGH